jgi:hypothetical protein
MGVAVYAHKVAETPEEVRYEFRGDPDAAAEGTLVIDKRRPTESWRVEGEGASTGLARRVAARAYRRFQETGQWPERAAHIA